MRILYDWVIPSVAFLVWAILIITMIPFIMRQLKKKAEQTRHAFDEIIVSAIGIPLILFLIGLGLNLFIDILPRLPEKWLKYSNAFLILLFVLSGYFFLDRLMVEVLRRYKYRAVGSHLHMTLFS
jgi:hypothetical protein